MNSEQHTEEQQLIERLRAGEQRAFAEVVGRHQGAMRALALGIVGNRHADEVVQDAWLALVRHLDGFEQRCSLRSWLLTITANGAKSRLRREKRELLLDDLPAPHGTLGPERFAGDGHWSQPPAHWHDDSPQALLEQEVLRECLQHTLASLPQMQSAVLDLRERDGLELAEIARLLEISQGNVRVLLHRARLKVFATLEHFEETGEC